MDVESLFSNDLHPKTNYLENKSNSKPINPSYWKQTSQSQANENHPHRSREPQDHLDRDTLLQGLWGDSRTTCRGLILDLTSSSNTTHLALRLVEMSGMWRLPKTVVIAIGGRAGVRAVLLHHSLRNTVHALYLALHHELYLALHNDLHLALLHDSQLKTDSRLRKLLAQEASGGVRVYRRCLYCNNGEADAQLVHNMNINSPDLPWDDLFHESLQDLMGNKMRIATPTQYFPYVDYQRVNEAPGTTVLLRDSIDARLIHTFAATLNFTFEIHEEPNRTWGVEMTVGNFSGMIGLLQREQIDFCTVTGPLANRLRVVEYLKCYPSDPFTVTSLKPTLLPKYLALVRPFEGELWVALLVSVVMWGVTLWLLQRAWQWVAGGRRVGLIPSLLYGYGALMQNLPSDPSISVSGRMLVGWWLVFCLIITTGFSSSLMAHLTVKERSRPLETLEDLVNQPHWKWGTDPWMLTEAAVDYFSKHPNPVTRHIFHKMEVMQVDDALRKVLAGGFSFISYKNYVTVIIETRYSDVRGNTPLYISNKAFPILAAFGWGIRKGAPFLQRFTQLMTRLEAAGIITYWTGDLMARRVREERKAPTLLTTTILVNTNQDEGEEVVLSLNHLQGAFYMLLVGSCVAFLTLLGENLAHCCSSPQ
ncbi:glutamate receptor ionotropic, delta-1-like [Procambarus clarkii]|uniref:glutamate receptor ionotropic, delta-1-like n=1 Tax=Procambarus clarkii TaxID=6728 RepID=UPI003744965A